MIRYLLLSCCAFKAVHGCIFENATWVNGLLFINNMSGVDLLCSYNISESKAVLDSCKEWRERLNRTQRERETIHKRLTKKTESLIAEIRMVSTHKEQIYIYKQRNVTMEPDWLFFFCIAVMISIVVCIIESNGVLFTMH
jgi:hypothetical protein